MTPPPTHTTRDGRPVTIDKIGKRWMRGWIVQEGATCRLRWYLSGKHKRKMALDLTPVANAHLTAIIASSRDLFDDIPEPDPRDAEIERLRGMNAEFVAFFQNVRPWMGQTSREKFDTILARNGGKP